MTLLMSLKGAVPPPFFIPSDVMRRQCKQLLTWTIDRKLCRVRLYVPGVGRRSFVCSDAWRGEVQDRRRLALSNRAWPKGFRFPDASGTEWRFGRQDFIPFAGQWLKAADARARWKWNAEAALDRLTSSDALWRDVPPSLPGSGQT